MITLLLTVLASASAGQGQVPTLFDGRLFPTGLPATTATRITQIEVVDFDGDGTLDIVGLFRHSNFPPTAPDAVFVQLGGNDAEFDSVEVEITPDGLQRMKVAHFDSDAFLDVVVTHWTPSGFTVFRGLGDGQLAPGVTTTVDDATISGLDVADMDLDGVTDLVFSTFSASSTRIALGLGDGTFATPVVVSPLGFGRAVDVDGQFGPDLISGANVALATATPLVFQPAQPTGAPGGGLIEDVTGDGIIDVITYDDAQFYADRLEVFAGNGDGTFVQILDEFRAGGDVIIDVDAGDVDGDGVTDLVVHLLDSFFLPPELVVFRGLGGSAFAPPVGYVGVPQIGTFELEDLDGDQRADLVYALALDTFTSVLMAGPTGNFMSPSLFDFGPIDDVAVAPLDGLPGDEIVATRQGLLVTWTSDGNGGFSELNSPTAIAQNPRDFTLADVDQDGNCDAVTIGATGITTNLRVHPGLGDGTFQTNMDLAGGPLPVAVGVGDLDSNGALDLATIAEDGSFMIHPGLTNGGFGAPTAIAYAPKPGGMIVGDLDVDGRDDVVIAHPQDALVVRYQDSFGALEPAMRIPTLDQPCCNPNLQGALALGQWNDDAIPDIAVQVTAGVAVHLSTGPRSYSPPTLLRSIDNQFDMKLACADINGDGRDDLVIRNSTLIVLFGDGRGGFPQRHHYLGSPSPRGLAVGDVDGVGGLDIVLSGYLFGYGGPTYGAILLNKR